MGSRRLFFGKKGEIMMEAVCGIAVIVGFFRIWIESGRSGVLWSGKWLEETGGYQFCLDAPVVSLEYRVRMVSDVRGM